MIQFQISTRNSGRKRTIQVCIYDTVKELREAADKHNKRIGNTETGLDKAHGLCQSLERVFVYDSGRIRRTPTAGFIRLYKPALKTGIIAHEATHMAVAIYKQDVQKTIPDMDREETLCYLVGDITSQIVRGIYKYNLLQEPTAL